MAETLYPDEPAENAVGKTVYINADNPVQIVGVMGADAGAVERLGWGRALDAGAAEARVCQQSLRDSGPRTVSSMR